MITFKLHESLFEKNPDGFVVGWSSSSSLRDKFPDWRNFVVVVGDSSNIIVKVDKSITDETFGGSRGIMINYSGSSISKSTLHGLVHNFKQQQALTQILDYVNRKIIQVFEDGVEMTESQIANYSL